MFAFVLDGAGEKSASTAGRVEYDLVQFGIDTIDDESGDGARSVKLAGIACALQIFKYLLVDASEGVAIFFSIEIDLANIT
jgi:hypothetical protein